MKRWIALLSLSVALTESEFSYAAEKATYPSPRFPSYTKAS
jgi:hypothetical protein